VLKLCGGWSWETYLEKVVPIVCIQICLICPIWPDHLHSIPTHGFIQSPGMIVHLYVPPFRTYLLLLTLMRSSSESVLQ
jgi:hypothetical protein